MPVTLTEVDEALKALWSGATITTLEQGSGTPVEVFVEDPDLEEVPDRVYPSIAIRLIGIREAPESQDSEEFVQVGVDASSVPYVNTDRLSSEWHWVSYQVEAYTRDAAADRELVRWVMKRTRPKDAVTIVEDVYWIYRIGSLVVLDERQSDSVVYRKAWTYEVHVDIDNPDTDTQTEAVHEIELKTGVVGTRLLPDRAGAGRDELLTTGFPGQRSERVSTKPIDANNNPVAAKDAVFYKHRAVAFSDTDFLSFS